MDLVGIEPIEHNPVIRCQHCEDTLIDRNDRLLHREDEDVSEALASLFNDEGIDALLNARIKRVSGESGDSVTVVVEQAGKQVNLAGTHLLVAAGRMPNTENIGLELAGVEVTDRGYIKVNDRLETTAPEFGPSAKLREVRSSHM